MTDVNRDYWLKFWERAPGGYAPAAALAAPPPLTRYLLDLLARRFPNRAGRVLELGCGSGLTSLGLAAGGHTVIATDLSPAAIQRARVAAAAVAASGRSLSLQAEELDLRRIGTMADRGPFDLVLNCSTLEYLTREEIGSFAAGVVRLLAPGGWCVIVVPHLNFLARLAGALYYRREQHDREQVRPHTVETLTADFVPAGLRLADTRFYGSIPAGTIRDYSTSPLFALTIRTINAGFACLPGGCRPWMAFNVLLAFTKPDQKETRCP